MKSVHPVNLNLEARWRAIADLEVFSARTLSAACGEPRKKMGRWILDLEERREAVRVARGKYRLVAPVRF